jgi:hypothetical protein
MINLDTMTPVQELEAELQAAKAPQGFLSLLATKIAAFFRGHNAVAAAPSPKLESNRILAGEILQHVQKTVLFSQNYLGRSPVVEAEDDPDAYWARYDAADKVTDEIREHPMIKQDRIEHSLWNRACLAEKYSVGNCEEMAAVGLKYAMEKETAQPVSVFHILNGDHAFLVIGDGEDAYVCDPWASRCYPLSRHEIHLKDYVELCQLPNGRIVTGVRDFNPAKQYLDVIYTYPGKKEKLSNRVSQRPPQAPAPQKPPSRYQTLLRHKF